MTYRLVPFLAGLSLSAISCSGIPGATIAQGEPEIVRFSVPTLDD